MSKGGVKRSNSSDLGSSVARPLLLPGFDEYILGYGDRSHALTREQEALVVPGGNGIFRPTVIHRGRAVATWQRATRKGQPAVDRERLRPAHFGGFELHQVVLHAALKP